MKSFRPSNGTEGMMFSEQFCERCKHEGFTPGESPCEILGNTMFYDISDDEYPREWVQDDDGTNPRCTAFEEK